MKKPSVLDSRLTSLTPEQLARDLEIDITSSSAVRINRERLASIGDRIRERLSTTRTSPAKWDDPMFWNVEGTPRERSQYFAIGNAINYAKFFSRSHPAIIHVYDESGAVIETYEQAGDFKEW